MIDWLTLRADWSAWPEPLRSAVLAARDSQGRTLCIASDGSIEWEAFRRQTIRSDSHQVVCFIGSDFELTGSPARSMGLAHNVWGSDNVAACVDSHITAASKALGLELPRHGWRCTRIDVTFNYDLGGAAECRQALAYLRQADGGRYKVQQKSETVYWSRGSARHAGKAYHKGPHLAHQNRKGQAEATAVELLAADRLLRLELKLGRQWCEQHGYDPHRIAAVDLAEVHRDYFAQFVGDIQVTEMTRLNDRVEQAAVDLGLTKGQGLAAYRTWAVIGSVGHQAARASMPKATWYRHLKILRAAGLAWGDFAAGQVVPLRKKPLVMQPVTCWADMGVAA